MTFARGLLIVTLGNIDSYFHLRTKFGEYGSTRERNLIVTYFKVLILLIKISIIT